MVNPFHPANRDFDRGEIGPWTLWQGNRENPRLMIVGQDWGAADDFRDFGGHDSPGMPTNCTLRALLDHIGVYIARPGKDDQGGGPLFFTNSVLCLRRDRGAEPPRSCFNRCASKFLKPTIELVAPRFLVSLGYQAYTSIGRIYDFQRATSLEAAIRETADGRQLRVAAGATMWYFPMYHPGPRGGATRPLVEQLKDWWRMTKCADWLD